jgi:nitroreductase
MNEVLKNIYARRSVRAYADKTVPDDVIQDIIKAGVHAPNGANTQALRFAVITNKAKLKTYAEKGRVMSLMGFQKLQEQHPSEMIAHMIKSLSNPNQDIFYGAPVAVFIFTAPHCLTPVEDASLAAENMMLYAKSLGLGSCWIGFGKSLSHDPEFIKELNVPTDHQLIGTIIFGYPKKEDMQPSARDEPKILAWVK